MKLLKYIGHDPVLNVLAEAIPETQIDEIRNLDQFRGRDRSLRASAGPAAPTSRWERGRSNG